MKLSLNGKPDVPPRSNCKIIVVWRFTNALADNLGLLATESISVDFMSGNRLPIDINPSSSSITLKNNNSLIAASTTQSSITGTKIVSMDQSGLATWLSAYNGQADEIILEINDVVFDSLPGL